MFKNKTNFTRTMILILSFLLASMIQAQVDSTDITPQPFIIKGQVSIQFESHVMLNSNNRSAKSSQAVSFNLPSVDLLLDKFNASDARPVFPWRQNQISVPPGDIDLSRFYTLSIPDDLDVYDVVNELMQDANIKMAEPVWAIPMLAEPNDPLWVNQWAMKPSFETDPNFYTAWDTETGAEGIKVGIIDGGLNYNHSDLRDNIWVNPGEDIDGDHYVYDTDDLNGIDDDGNGIVDDLIGYDFFTGGFAVQEGEDGGGPDPDPNDWGGHGTHVAGIVAAVNNNASDVTGVAGGWGGGHRSFRGISLVGLKAGSVSEETGRGTLNSSSLAAAIDYATLMDIDVINNSWGGGGGGTVSAAFVNAINAGVTVIKAAGNDGCNCPDGYASINGLIDVASVGSWSNMKSGFSSYGGWVEVSAPGSEILSTNSYHYVPGTSTKGGTSMAAPMVAGLAALIRSMMPSLSRVQADSILLASADSTELYYANPSLHGLLGSGRIDAVAALSGLVNAKFSADITEGTAPLTVNFTDLSPNSPVAWDWSFGDDSTSSLQNPVHTYTEPGIYDVSLKIDENNPLGWGEENLKKYIWVTADTLRGDSIETSFNSQVVVPVYFNNSQQIKQIQYPFTVANSSGIIFDSISAIGTRAEYFEEVKVNAYDLYFGRYSVILKAHTNIGSTYLKPDTGAVFNLHFSVYTGEKGSLVLDTVSFAGKTPTITTIWGDYWPDSFTPGKINVSGCCDGFRGNVNGDLTELIDIDDVVYLVNYAFGFPPGPEPPCLVEADVDGNEIIDIDDIVYLVNYAFGFPPGPTPPNCF